jgi:hypothetical protein
MFFNSIAFSLFLSIIFVNAPEYIEGQIFTKNRDEVMSLYTKYSHQYNIPFYDFLLMLFTIKKNIFITPITITKWGLNYLLPNLLTH